jgi:hypothetical protein
LPEDEKKQINLNLSILEWQRNHLLYIETGLESEMQWAEWEILDTIFDGIELLYKKLISPSGNETKNMLQSYQASTHLVQE